MAKGNPEDRQRWKRTDWSKEVYAQTDPGRNPDGIYSGMTRRNAINSGAHVDVGNLPAGRREPRDPE